MPGDWIVLPGAGGGLGHLGSHFYSSPSLPHLNIALAVQYAVQSFGLRVVAIGLSFIMPLQPVFIVLSLTDTGAEKKELCKRLGAEKWIDFRETKDLVKEIKDATGGTGAHAALISAASVSIFCLTDTS